MTPFGISGLLTGVTSITLGLLVMLLSPNRRLGRIWFLFTASVSVYGFGVAWIGSTNDPARALLAWRVAYAFGVIWIAPLIYHFDCVFLGIDRRRSILFHYAIAALFLVAVPSAWFFSHVRWVFDSLYYARGGAYLYPLYFIWWMGLVLFSHYELIRAYPKASREMRNQIKYFLLTTLFGFTGGSLSYLPNFGIDLYPWGNFFVPLYPALMSYAIVKHRMMDLQFVIRQTLVYSTVTAGLTASFILISLYLARLFEQMGTMPWGLSTTLAAVAVTFLFHPLRYRSQRLVDRLFRRTALDPLLLSEATSGFAHEMARPLAGISLPAELCLMDIKDFRKGLTNGERLADLLEGRLATILSQALEAARKIEAIRQLNEQEHSLPLPLDVKALFEEVVRMEGARLDGIHLALDGLQDVPSALGRKPQMTIVIGNLLRNAAEAMASLPAEHRSITASWKRRGSFVILRVQDSGPGLPAQIRANLFSAYATTKGPKGMGLGLYLSRQLMQSQGGTLALAPQTGDGAAFLVQLPAAPEPQEGHL